MIGFNQVKSAQREVFHAPMQWLLNHLSLYAVIDVQLETVFALMFSGPTFEHSMNAFCFVKSALPIIFLGSFSLYTVFICISTCVHEHLVSASS
ncbi:hypothetical protein A6F49_02025 [Enteractinococcus helveticum]|uniref:Uncharacterized protein n=1 Tax=Enteractinococcus helveticum TaxID=1837282 RepID=A0A1B7LUY4_9MICC|nr:hypothetical protein A6F49_02025 [Enteractinococcus helveticum]